MDVNPSDVAAIQGMQASTGTERQAPLGSEMALALESTRHRAVDTSFAQEEGMDLDGCAAKYKAAFPASELHDMHEILRRVHVDAHTYKDYHDNPPGLSYGFTEKDRDERRTIIWNNFKISRVEAEREIGNTRNTYFPGFSIVSVAQWISTTSDPVVSSSPVDPADPVVISDPVGPFDRLYVEGDVYAFTRDAFVGKTLPR
ncbi:hypothetical protein PAQ31011_03438 [Pandoraea aquatica]|uniref:Uncharacterized protein n=1 Tax=Pandoraea aquatica TaxID=2508290 RepID=A0A5E4WNK4_9BURK|nr:hypothetical protein [Pandoraea aquatica]VVE26422.1 hypothetical protein PAQ31011_03438 [Pandoraea aquatica]